MFNDLNQTGESKSQAPVDDIFAETDKTAEAKKFSGYYSNSTITPGVSSSTEIETQKAGLSTTEDIPSNKGKILKIALIILLIILLLGLGYLVYAKFLAGKRTDQNSVVNSKVTVVNNTKATTTDKNNNETFGQDLNSISTTTKATDTIPVSQEVVITPSMPLGTTTPPVSLIDTDGDGLTDQEEKILGTNPNLVDTDGDGLSDYEEVKIYHTDPLKADTDGDGYTDGAEVKGGYNPLGAGKMIDVKK